MDGLDEEDVPGIGGRRFFLRARTSAGTCASSATRASGERDLRRRTDPGPVDVFWECRRFSRCLVEPVERRVEPLLCFAMAGGIMGLWDDADGILGCEMTGLLEELLERTEVTLTIYF